MHNGKKDGKCRKDEKEDGKDGGLFGKSTGAGNTSHNTDECLMNALNQMHKTHQV
jgi:hypothetical protein